MHWDSEIDSTVIWLASHLHMNLPSNLHVGVSCVCPVYSRCTGHVVHKSTHAQLREAARHTHVQLWVKLRVSDAENSAYLKAAAPLVVRVVVAAGCLLVSHARVADHPIRGRVLEQQLVVARWLQRQVFLPEAVPLTAAGRQGRWVGGSGGSCDRWGIDG